MTNKFNGEPCKICGTTLRYVKNNHCIDCSSAYNKFEYAIFQKEKIVEAQRWHRDNLPAHNEMMRAGQLKRKFGLTVEDYDRMVAEQEGSCAICRRPCQTGRRLAVDHCHKTGAVRGLLCHSCNLGIGKLGDDPERLLSAARYLLSHADDVRIGVIHKTKKRRVASISSLLL